MSLVVLSLNMGIYAKLRQEKQTAFYKEVKDMSANEAASRLVEICSIERHVEEYEDAAEWLPLDVWKTRGFNSDAIRDKSHPSDKRPHPISDWVYRVALRKDTTKTQRVTQKTDRLSMSGQCRPIDVSGASGSAQALLALKDKDKESDDSSGSSSSSSSSAKKKKKSKKSKKSKKDKKSKKEKKRGREDDNEDFTLGKTTCSPSSANL